MTELHGTDRQLGQALEIKLSFDGRWDASSPGDKHLTIRALLACADTLSRRLGFRPDEFMFGSDRFDLEQVDYLRMMLDRLWRHAADHEYHQGVTAVSALQTVAALMHVTLSSSDQPTLMNAKVRLNVFAMRLKALVDQYHAAS